MHSPHGSQWNNERVFGLAARRRMSVMLVGVAVVTVGCGGSSATKPSAPSGSTGAHIARPVGATPSKSAQMICSAETQQALVSDAIGIHTTEPAVATWKDDLYSCRYVYGTKVMVLSVKELANKTDTDDYFASLERQLRVARTVPLGQGAFVSRNGSVVVRKDYKVLFVDMAKLPLQFGEPLDSRENLALNAAAAIMGCWTGE
jgi:hypothetical protein